MDSIFGITKTFTRCINKQHDERANKLPLDKATVQ